MKIWIPLLAIIHASCQVSPETLPVDTRAMDAAVDAPLASETRAVLASFPSPLFQEGAGAGATAGSDDWEFEVTPYVWAAGIEGEATVGGNTADFDRSFSDLFDAVDFAGSLVGTAQHGRYIGWLQYDFFSFDTDEFDVPVPGNPGGKFESDINLLEAALGYQVDGWYEGQTFDFMLGLRLLDIDSELRVNGVGTVSYDDTLVDPMLVIRPYSPLFTGSVEGLSFSPTIGIGGGGDSEFIYELAPQLVYQWNDDMNVRFGYRRVGYEFEGDAGNDLQVQFAGLLLGVGFQF